MIFSLFTRIFYAIYNRIKNICNTKKLSEEKSINDNDVERNNIDQAPEEKSANTDIEYYDEYDSGIDSEEENIGIPSSNLHSTEHTSISDHEVRSLLT